MAFSLDLFCSPSFAANHFSDASAFPDAILTKVSTVACRHQEIQMALSMFPPVVSSLAEQNRIMLWEDALEAIEQDWRRDDAMCLEDAEETIEEDVAEIIEDSDLEDAELVEMERRDALSMEQAGRGASHSWTMDCFRRRLQHAGGQAVVSPTFTLGACDNVRFMVTPLPEKTVPAGQIQASVQMKMSGWAPHGPINYIVRCGNTYSGVLKWDFRKSGCDRGTVFDFLREMDGNDVTVGVEAWWPAVPHA